MSMFVFIATEADGVERAYVSRPGQPGELFEVRGEVVKDVEALLTRLAAEQGSLLVEPADTAARWLRSELDTLDIDELVAMADGTGEGAD